MDSRKFKIAFRDTTRQFEGDLRNETSHYHGHFNFVVRAMHFSYDYSADTEISQKLTNGTWKGLISLLNRSEVDYAPAGFIVTEERWDAMAFNYPYVCDDYTFVSKKPNYNPETVAIFQTLTVSVWLSLLISIILVTLMIFMVLRYRYTLNDVTLHVLAISLNQLGNIVSNRAVELLLLGTWMVAMTLFIACFKFVLLSFLSFPPLTGVRTVPELAAAIQSGKYSVKTRKRYIPTYLQGSSNEEVRLIREHTLKNLSGYPERVA